MSEQPSTSTPVQPKRLWLAFGLWLALLAANLVTSYAVISASTVGGWMAVFFQTLIRTNSSATALTSSAGDAQFIVAFIGVGLALAIAGLILNAWLKFARMSHALIVSLAWLERDETGIVVFFDWLIFSNKTTETTPAITVEGIDLDEAASTVVSQIIKSLGIAWALLLVLLIV